MCIYIYKLVVVFYRPIPTNTTHYILTMYTLLMYTYTLYKLIPIHLNTSYTGTPLQNNLMELWSLMHFLMPHIFRSRKVRTCIRGCVIRITINRFIYVYLCMVYITIIFIMCIYDCSMYVYYSHV